MHGHGTSKFQVVQWNKGGRKKELGSLVPMRRKGGEGWMDER